MWSTRLLPPCWASPLRASACLAASWLALVLPLPTAHAQSTSPAPAERSQVAEELDEEEPPGLYRSHIEAALGEYRAHRFPEARSLFAKAHAVFPNARTWRGLGMVEFELRNYVDAASLFARALACPVRPLAGPLREDTEQLRQRAEGFVGHYEVESEQPLLVSVDAVPCDLQDESLALAVGDHVLELSAPGYVSERRLLRVRGGERERLSVALQPLDATLLTVQAEPPPPSAHLEAPALIDAEQAPHEPRRWSKNKWLWTGVGVVTAAAAVGLGFALTARDGRTEDPISARPIAIRSGP